MAGRIWKTLGKKGRVDILKLSQILNEKEFIVYQGLGWLAREGKIDFHKTEGRTLVSLSQEEQEIFKDQVNHLSNELVK